MFWVIVAMLVVAYLGNGVFVSRFLMNPWIAKEFGGCEILTACAIVLFWPIALALDFLS
jgi:hypothetical protein